MFKFFDTKDVDALAKRMVDDLVKRVPPANFGGGGRKAEAKKDRAHDLVLREASDFVRGHKLNVYTKARLANNFKWALLDGSRAQPRVLPLPSTSQKLPADACEGHALPAPTRTKIASGA